VALINAKASHHLDLEYQGRTPILKIEPRGVTSFRCLRRWHEVPGNFFYIDFKDADAFGLVDLSSLIPADILRQIMDPASEYFLLLVNSHEAFNRAVMPIYKHIVINQHIPAPKCVLYTGSFTANQEVERIAFSFGLPKIKVVISVEFEKVIKDTLMVNLDQQQWVEPNTLTVKAYPKKFLNFNRRWRYHRPMLTALLNARGLLDNGFISLGPSDDNRNWQNSWEIMSYISNHYAPLNDFFLNNQEHIQTIPYMYLDKQDLTINHVRLENSVYKYYEDTYFSVVSETNYFDDFENFDEPPFLSEKTFKAIAFKHPFILVSSYNTLAYLKSIGYKTFSPFIDERYDTVKNSGKRLMMIADEIERLCNLTETQLHEFIEFCKPIVEHNYSLLTSPRNYCYEVL
jgi:hypothetical protein